MSLVRSVEPSETSRVRLITYPNAKNPIIMQPSISSPSMSCEEDYLLDSPTMSYPRIVNTGVSGSRNVLQIPSGTSATLNNFASDYMENEISESEAFDAEAMRLKLQELEALLCDDDFEGCDMDQNMELNGEWDDSNTVRNTLHQESPKESTSSNLSCVCSIKEITLVPIKTTRELLIHCASTLAEGKLLETSSIINQLRQMVSIQGDPHERIAAYMVEGLAARMAESGKGLYRALKCKEPPTTDQLAAMQILFEVCPCFKFGFIAANGVILEAIRDEKRVHIIDFDINQGNQYITLLQTLAASCKSKPPHLRLTGVDDPESVQRSVGGLKIIGQRLEQLAEALNLPFEFHTVASATSDVTPDMLQRHPNEILIVNFAFQLHHMPDESVSTINQRDQLLRMIKRLNPKLVTIVEQDVNTNTSSFIPRFVEAYNYYSAVFESLDVTLPRDSQDRINVERQCLARDIVNIVACEGEERIERYEVAGKWRARMMMAGFTSCPVSINVRTSIRNLIESKYCNKYKMEEEMGGVLFGWQDKNLIVASAWR